MKRKERRPRRAHQQHKAGTGPVALAGVPEDPAAVLGGRRSPRRSSRRRSRRTRQVLPPQEGLQVLHREDRRHPLSGCPSAAGICGRARQDCAASFDWCMHHAPAPPDARHQAGPQHRPAAVCDAPLKRYCVSRFRWLALFAGGRRQFRNVDVESFAAQPLVRTWV